ncbi:hypothetical protein CCP3SC15_6550002 [Gammaproteobacteria bacterium]
MPDFDIATWTIYVIDVPVIIILVAIGIIEIYERFRDRGIDFQEVCCAPGTYPAPVETVPGTFYPCAKCFD